MAEVLQHTPGQVKPGNRMDLFRVLLTIGIVCRHATSDNLRPIVIITEVCVPLFFALSGYLFFVNAPEKPDVKWFWGKYRSRFFTLVIPYIIAVVIAWGCYFFAYTFTPSLVDGFFADRWKDPLFVFWTGPVNLSLWFIRELIVLVLLSPLVYLLVRYTTWFGVLALGALWVFKLGGPEPLFFFSAGACLAVHKIGPVEHWLHTSVRWPDIRCRAWTYFVYLYHYLLLIGVKKGLASLLHPASVWADAGIWLASVVIVLAVLTAVYALMRRLMPRMTGILVGGK